MVSDDERREVAERLRKKSRKYARELFSRHTSINAYHEVREVLYGTDGAPKSLCEFFDRLADLIDPDCDEGRYSVARTARPVDRDALLALAEELEGEGLDGWASGPVNVGEYARRIREACGEVVE